MATLNGQPINLQNAGLVSAAGRRLSAPFGAKQLGEEEEGQDAQPGNMANSLNPFSSIATVANAPQVGAAPALKQFSFNPKYAGLSAQFERDIADAGLKRSNAISQTEDVYKTQLSDAERLQSEAVRRLQDRLAVRGLGSSSIMLNERGQQEGNYQRFLDNLGRMRANQLAQAEMGYGQALEGVNRGREGLYFQQVQEEEQLARERARQEAERAQREQELAAQRQFQEQMRVQAEQAAAAQQAAAQRLAEQQASMYQGLGGGGNYGVGYGGGGGGGGGYAPPANDAVYGLPNGQMVNADTFMHAVQNAPDQNWLNYLWDRELGLPSNIRQAVLGRISANRGWGGGSLAAL